MVLQAEGFKGAIIRSVAAGIFILPNPGYPTRFFAKPADCLGWVSTQIGLPPGDISAAIEATIAKLR